MCKCGPSLGPPGGNVTKILEKKAYNRGRGYVSTKSPCDAGTPMRFLANHPSFEKRWALREIKAHEPILRDPRRRGTREKKKSPMYCSGYTQTKRLETRTVSFRATLLYHRKWRMNRTLSHWTRHNSRAHTQNNRKERQ